MNSYSIYTPSVKERILLFLSLVVATESVGFLIYDTKLGAIAAIVIYPFIEIKYKGMMIVKRRNKLRNQFKDVLYSLSSSFAAGEHMSTAMKKSIDTLRDIYGDGTDMEYELKEMLKRIDEVGDDETWLWRDFGERSGVEDIRDFSEVYGNCRDAGGDLVKTVDRATDILSERISIENEIRLIASQKLFEGRLVGVMPVLMILFMRLTSPSYMRVMYETAIGRIVMTISALMTLLAFYVTERVTNIEV